MNKEHKDPETVDLKAPPCKVSAQSVEETSKHGVLGRYQTCSKEMIKVLSDAIERYHPSRNTPSLLYPEGYQDGKLDNSKTKKYMRHLDFLQRFL